MDSSDIELWLRDRTTQWFIANLGERYGGVDQQFRNATTIEGIFRLRGIAEVMDVVNGMLKNPETFD